MTSPLPPRRRDSRNLGDLIRQDRQNLRQLGVGLVGGRFAPARPVKPRTETADLEDDSFDDDGGEVLNYSDSDTAAWSGAGALRIQLAHTPWSESLRVRLNGHELEPADWTYSASANVVTIDPEPWWQPGEVGSAYYAYFPGDDPDVIAPNFRDAAPQNLNGFIIPASAHVGDLLVALAMMPTTESVTALNGWTFLGASDYVTHTAVGGAAGGTRTYRLEAYTFINDGSSVPTVSNVAAQDVVCSMAAFSGGTSVEAVFTTLADGVTASAPAQNPTSLRVWGTISDTASLSASRGTTILSTNYIEIDTLMTIDTDPTPAPATATGSAGWCLASLAVTA